MRICTRSHMQTNTRTQNNFVVTVEQWAYWMPQHVMAELSVSSE